MISVIIPVYNVENYLHVCLNSVLNQSYGNFEIICIDDASTDSSLEILEYFTQKDSRIKILKNDVNMGPGFSRNRGLEVAHGNYISFLDGDDWLSPNAFEILIKKAEENDLDLLMFKNIVYYEEPSDFGMEEYYDMEFMDKFENKVFNHFDLDKTKLFKISNAPWNKFYLKSFLDENDIRFPNENLIHEDNPFFCKVITHARRISLINEYLHNRRRRPNSIMTLNNERLFDSIDICYLILDVFLENYQLYQYYKKEVLTYIFSNMLNGKYFKIEDRFKEEFFIRAQNVFRSFIKYYGLKEVILNNVGETILDRFKFDDLLDNLPKISIVVPTFNVADYLPNFFNALLNQTMNINDLEVLFVDDCSNDGSGEILDEFVSNYKNMCVIHLTQNSGSPSKPRNVGIVNAIADYLMFQDPEEVLAPNSCELLYNTMIEEDVDFVGGMTRSNDDVSGHVIDYHPWATILNNDEEIKKLGAENILDSDELFKYKINSFDENPLVIMDYCLNTKLYKKSFFLKNHFKFREDLMGGEDSVVLLKCFVKAKGICFINKLIYDYDGLMENSISYDYDLKTIQSNLVAYKLMYDFACQNNIKDLFVNVILGVKLNYWINSLVVKSNVVDDDLISIFMDFQILFSECVTYNVNMSDFTRDFCNDIKNNDFNNAVRKINALKS